MTNEKLNFKVERIHKVTKDGSLKAFVDLNINDQLLFRGLRIVNGQKGLFVSMPQEKGKDNKWYDTIRCLSPDVRFAIQKEVMAAYEADKK